MQFKVVDSVGIGEKNTVYLINNKWDDWFTYETVFSVVYFDEHTNRKNIGGVKIGQKNQEGRRPLLPKTFQILSDEFFSLGTSEEYYEKIKSETFREDYMNAMNDIAFDLEFSNRKQDSVRCQFYHSSWKGNRACLREAL